MNINLTEKQKEFLGINDERIDFYFKIENAIVDTVGLFDDVYEFAVFVVLCRYCNNGGVAFASCETLAKQSYCSVRKLKDVLKSLIEKGLIKKVERGGNQTNVYKIQTLKDYAESDKQNKVNSLELGVHHEKINGSHSAQGVASMMQDKANYSAPCAHNKELLIKNNFKKNTTTRNSNRNSNIKNSKKIFNSNSPIFSFLDLEEFSKLNNVTKKNIRKNIKDLSIEKFREIYLQTEKYIASGKGESFDAILYQGLTGDWNFHFVSTNSSTVNPNSNIELDEDKLSWLSYFSGLKTNKELYSYVKNAVIKIPLDILKQNKSKLAKMDLFQFKNHIAYLLKQSY